MTSATYLVEVRDDGMVAIGHLDRVTRTVSMDFGDGTADGERWIQLRGRIRDVDVRDQDEATLSALAAIIAGASS